MPTAGQFIEWREKRGKDRWKDPLYLGLVVHLPSGETVIVSKLSHGLRVLPYPGTDQYGLEVVEMAVEIPDDFLSAIEGTYLVDRAFQNHTSTFESLLKEALQK